MSQSALTLDGLGCGYLGQPIVQDVTLTIQPGEFVGVLGPNGAGKSTLVKTLAGILPPLAGEVALFGQPLGAYSARALARARAYMPQESPPDTDWQVEEVVAMGRFAHQAGWGLVGHAKDHGVIARALAQAGLTALSHRRLGTLSGGQRQRVYLARALAQGAPLLLLDEPTSHLDLAHQLEFFHLIRQVIVSERLTVVAVLHDLNLAAQFCQRLLVVKGGRLLADGPPEAVLEPGLIAEAFNLQVQVRHHPETGLPYILPLQLARQATGPSARLRGAARQPLHVIAGGGAGSSLVPALYRLGYELSVGVVNSLDSDQALASRLGLPVITEAPFSPLSAENLLALGQRLSEVPIVVVANVAWGAGNVGNLRALAALPQLPRVYLAEDTPLVSRDFTGGEASRLVAGLIGRGAIALPTEALLRALSPGGTP